MPVQILPERCGESSPENWNDFGGGFGANLGEFVTEFWWILEAHFGGYLETALKTALELRLRNRP